MFNHNCGKHPVIRDMGPKPLVFNIEHATNMNQNFRTTLWTGTDMQLTLMCIPRALFTRQKRLQSTTMGIDEE